MALARALLLLGLAVAVSSAQAAVQVTRITADNADALVMGGPDAVGGIGDWFLSNGTLCAIVSGVEHETDLSANGGVLVDLGFCGRDDDHFVSTQELLDASRSRPVDVRRVEPAQGTDSASLLALGGHGGLHSETRYTVTADEPTTLHISRRLRRSATAAPNPGLFAPVTFNYQSLLPFVLASTDARLSTGFRHELFFSRGVGAIPAAAQNADTIILVTPPDAPVPISYGWQLRGAQLVTAHSTERLPRFALADAGALAFVVPVESFWLGDGASMGTLQLLQVPLMGLDVGSTLEIDERLLIGRDGSVAAITDQLFPAEPRLSGEIVGRRALVHVDLPDGTPVTAVRPGVDGRFAARLPARDYRLRVLAPGDVRAELDVRLAADGTDVGPITLAQPARVRLPRGEAMRIVFRGIDGTPDPDLQDSLTDFAVIDDTGAQGLPRVPMVFLAGIASDRELVDLPPGRYRVYATRGIEHDLGITDIEVRAGETLDLAIAVPQPVVPTPDHLAADLHVHAAPSMDNAFSTVERVRTFAAEHGEVMVAAEHETVHDFAPLIERMGLGRQLVAVTGTEMTSEVRTDRMPWTAGHANFFPLRYLPHAFRRGAPANENRRLRDVLHDVRSRHPGVVAQLNHVRESDALSGVLPEDYAEHMSTGAYFEHLGIGEPFRPAQPLASGSNRRLIEPDPVTGVRDIDFDAMEIMNGTHEYSPTRTAALRQDWFALMRQGVVLTGTANSDSHGKAQQVGLPRNMVRMADDDLAAFDESAFAEAIRAGRLYGTTGPLLEVSLDGVEIGGRFQGDVGMLAGRVLVAPWVAADRLVVQVDGVAVHDQALDASGRFEVPLRFERDAFVTLEVIGEPGDDYRAVYPGHRPYAFSNPIFVDADGDGRWSAPGL